MICEQLRRLVKIPSPTGSETELAMYCEQVLREQGFQTQRQAVAGRFNLLAERGSGAETLLCAHLDTVPAADNWQHDPYQLQTTGDRLSGLGANDMKAGLAILLSLASEPALSNLPLKMALTVDEEAWSAGAWQLVKSDWCKGLKRVLVPEGVIDSSRAAIGYGRRGHGVFSITFQGEAAHAALSRESKHTAIGQLAAYIMALPALETYLAERDQVCQVVVRQIASATTGLSYPARAEAEFSCFSDPGSDLAQIFSLIQQDLGMEFPEALFMPAQRPTPAPEAYCLAPDDPDLKQLTQAYATVIGQTAELAIGVSPADENVYYQCLEIPVFSLAPVGSLAHQAGEWVSAQSLQEVKAIYVEFLRSYSC